METIKSCGISFEVWKNKNEDGKVFGLYDLTSLMGDDKKKLLKHLPNKLRGILQPKFSVIERKMPRLQKKSM